MARLYNNCRLFLSYFSAGNACAEFHPEGGSIFHAKSEALHRASYYPGSFMYYVLLNTTPITQCSAQLKGQNIPSLSTCHDKATSLFDKLCHD